jgi:outer membrane PBP1 activator LpoA protein
MNRHYLLHLSFYLLLLTGCATQPAQRYLQFDEAVQAESYIQSGQPKQAAKLYQTLAQTKPAHRAQFSLLAAQAHIKAGDSHVAQSRLDGINPVSLSVEQQNKFNLLYAQIHLSNGDTELAINKLNIIQLYNLEPVDKITFYQSRAFAYSLTGEMLQSAQARVELDPLLGDDQQRHENNKVIFNTLKLISSQELTLNQPTAPDILGGWMALTRILKSAELKQNLAEYQTRVNEWKRLFPQHPANPDFVESYAEDSQHSFSLPSSIAILLPESGRFAKAAAAIKEGFLAAYGSSQSSFQPPVRFYDSASANPVNLYNQAIAEGANLVVGPLSKDNIQILALGAELTVPVLALNHVPNLGKDNFFQFGLSPIDDVQQISRKASLDGHKKALLLIPNSKQGQRIADYFSEYWENTGGRLVETQLYDSRENDFSVPIKKLLNLDQSTYRYKRLKRFLAKNIQYTERRRQDIDSIFLSAYPQTARSIYPQLQFYRANRIPIYATANIYSGLSNSSLDRDLNSIVFCDIPWIFPEAYQGELSKEALRSKWQHLPNRYLRLLALGIDSFNVIRHLEHLDSIPYAGATGKLLLNRENRVTRELACAKFIDGKAVLQ